MMSNARINRFRLPRPLRMMLIAAAMLLVFAVIAYAVDSVVQQVINWDAGLSAVEGQPLNFSQTVNGYTVSLQWAHADANRISIGYAVSGREGMEYTNLESRSVTLTDGAGNVFPLAGGMGNAVENGVSGNVSWFDASVLGDLPNLLDLRLEMYIEIATAAARTRTPNGGYEDWFEGPIGPFIFEFSLQTGEQRVIDVRETVTESGIPVTLRRLVISESQTRLEVCFDNPDPIFDSWVPAVWLFVNERDLIAEGTGVGGGRIEGTNCYFNVYNLALGEETGEWRVEVRRLIGTSSNLRIEEEHIPTLEAAGAAIYEDENGLTAIEMSEGGWETVGLEQHINGPWVFTVQVE